MKKIFLIPIFLLVLLPFAHAFEMTGFFSDFITGKAFEDFGSVEEKCKRHLALNEDDEKTFNFDGSNYLIKIVSIEGNNVNLKINSVPYTLNSDILKTPLSDKASITLDKITETNSYYGIREGVTFTLNKESDMCSCVSNLITVKPGIVNFVSDGTNEFKLEIPEFLYDENYKAKNYLIYKINGITTEKTKQGETVVISQLKDLKIVTKSINSDNTATIMIDNSFNCQLQADLRKQITEEKERALIYLGKLVTLQLNTESDTTTTYLVTIPKGEEGSVAIVSSEGKFDIMGKKLAEEKAKEIVCPEPPAKKKGFWANLGF